MLWSLREVRTEISNNTQKWIDKTLEKVAYVLPLATDLWIQVSEETTNDNRLPNEGFAWLDSIGCKIQYEISPI